MNQPDVVLIGFDTEAEGVYVPRQHTVVTGTTGGGKTTTVRRMVDGFANQGERALLFDVKRDRDYAGIGEEVSPVMEQGTDPLLLMRLLEGVADFSMKSAFNLLIEICRGARDLAQVRERCARIVREEAARREKSGRGRKSRREEEAEKVLYFLDTWLGELKEHPCGTELRLTDAPIQVMDLSMYSDELQALIVDSALKQIVKNERDLIVVLEEAARFVPEAASSTAKKVAAKITRDGRSAGLWVWMAGQQITGIEKGLLKNVKVWIMGQQTEENEIAKVLRQIPLSDITPKDVMGLPVGWFYVVDATAGLRVRRTYVKPSWMGDAEAQRIAKAGVAPPLGPPKKEIERKVARAEAAFRAPAATAPPNLAADLGTELVAATERIKKLERRNAELETELRRWRAEHAVPSPDLEGTGFKATPALKAALQKRESPPKGGKSPPEEGSTTESREEPANVEVERVRPQITVKWLRERVDADSGSLRGKVAILIADGCLKDTVDFAEIAHAADEHGWKGWNSGGTNRDAVREELDWYARAGHVVKTVLANGKIQYRAADDALAWVKKKVGA